MLLSRRKCVVNKERSIHATVTWQVTLADGLKSFWEPPKFHSHVQ